MLILEPCSELIWEDTQSYGFASGTMMFSLFFIDPMKSKEEIDQEMLKVTEALNLRFDPWIMHYVWDKSPVQIKLISDDANYENSYIYGELVYDQILDDQELVTSILFEFSKTYPDLYIHMSDNDGEFLLVETYEHLPEWLEPNNSSNRDWVNHGRVLIIPEEYYLDRGLKLIEALKFLEKAVYKCVKVLEIDKALENKLNEYPTRSLEGQCELELRIPRVYAGLLMNSDKSLLNLAVSAAINSQEELNKIDLDSDRVELKVRSTTLCFASIEIFLKQEQAKEHREIDHGELASYILNKYVFDEKLDLNFIPSDEEIKKFNEKGDVLQKELIRLLRIEKYVEPRFDTLDENIDLTKDDFDETEIMDRLNEFFEDNEAGIDGIENKTKAKTSLVEEIDSENDSDETDEEERREKKIEEILKKEGIDEDDFFEFFAKEALKLKDEDLEQFRNLHLNEEKKEEEGTKNDEEFMEEYDSEEEREIIENLSTGDVASLQDLLKMFATSGTDGPASTFLQNLGKS